MLRFVTKHETMNMNDTFATTEDCIAMLMAMGVAASAEEACWALGECGGNIDSAIALLDRDTIIPPRRDTSYLKKTARDSSQDTGADKPPGLSCVVIARDKGK
jgi:hypothetical protein